MRRAGAMKRAGAKRLGSKLVGFPGFLSLGLVAGHLVDQLDRELRRAGPPLPLDPGPRGPAAEPKAPGTAARQPDPGVYRDPFRGRAGRS